MIPDGISSQAATNDANIVEALHVTEEVNSVCEIESLKSECMKMAGLLKRIREEEHMLQLRNDIIARATVDAGYIPIDTKSWQLKAKKAKKQSRKS